jgi:uroporphyrinogen-III synthase
MRVLIIRPEMQGVQTARKIADLGHDCVVFPLYRPHHDLAAAIGALKKPHVAIAVTSAEAIRCLMRLGAMLEPYLDTTVFAVGKATARQAREAGFREVVVTQGGGQDLAATIFGYFAAVGTQDVPVLYLAGAKRMSDFEDTLEIHGIGVITAVIYGMERVDYGLVELQKLLVNHPVDAAFFFSKENARAFFDLEVFQQSKESLRKTLFFCLSRNIADAVPEEFKHSAVISLNPDEDELIDLL